MKSTFISAAFCDNACLDRGPGSPIDALSELRMSHTWLINGGNVPTGITIDNLSSTFEVSDFSFHDDR